MKIAAPTNHIPQARQSVRETAVKLPSHDERGGLQGYIPTLDGWRALAIIAVMVFHATHFFFSASGPYPSYYGWLLTQHGDKGVDVFFALSGILICSRLIEEHNEHGRISLKGFYLRRAFRILPPYLFYLIVVATISAIGLIPLEEKELLSCVFFVRNYVSSHTPSSWYTGHFWSLSVEEHFYLLWPALLVLCGIRRCRWLAPVLAGTICVWRMIAHLWLGQSVGMRTDTRLDALLWGCTLALALSAPGAKQWLRRRLSMPGWLVVVACILLLAVFRLERVELAVSSMLYPLLIIGTVLHPNTVVARVLELGFLRWLGRLSYSLYLWHVLFMIGSYKVARPYPLGALQQMPLNLVAAVMCATFSYYIVEKPFLRLGRRLSDSVTVQRDGGALPETLLTQKTLGNVQA